MSASPKRAWEGLFDFENPVFAGGTSIAILAGAAALGRRGILQGAGLIKRGLLVNLRISKQDLSYQWVLQWLAVPRPGGRIITRLTTPRDLSMKTVPKSNDNPGTKFKVQPGFGRYLIRHKNAWISVNREEKGTSNMSGGEPYETLTLTTIFAHQHIFEDIFRESYRLAALEKEGKTIVHTSRGVEWEQLGEASLQRPLDSVILDSGIKERVMVNLKSFLGSQKRYQDRGIPYRRGYLLYGPPGTGKTSFIEALAGELGFDIALINLGERGMTDDRLIHLVRKLPPRSILLLEDADVAFGNRKKAELDGYRGPTVTFSGLLNALDGVSAGKKERISFLTTNHIERLDEALIRPGRVDLTVRIGYASRQQVGEMWDRFYQHIDDGKGRQRFLARLEELGLVAKTSTAALQTLFLFNEDDMEGAIEMAEEMLIRKYESEPEKTG